MPKDRRRSNLNGERLQKYLAAAGIGSRRKIDEWITQGKITVDGKVARPGDRVTSTNNIKINGRQLKRKSAVGAPRVLLYNKPEGEICTRSDPRDRPTVYKNLPKLQDGRWVAVGRLDINTRGLILFTNNGDLANDLMHPGAGLEREYLCRVYGNPGKEALERLRKGIRIDGQLVRFYQLRRQRGENRNTWYSAVVTEGKKREVRRMWEAVGCKLSRLFRIRYGKVCLPRGLKLGGHVELDSVEIERLMENGDDDTPFTPAARARAKRRVKHR
jgi:23S rRNA pseudouridine2605 synthase